MMSVPGSFDSRSVTSFNTAAHGSVMAMAIIFQSASPSSIKGNRTVRGEREREWRG